MKFLVMQDLRSSQLCCWRWSLLGSASVSLAEWFPSFCRIMVHSKRWEAVSQQYTLTSQKTWILSPQFSIPSLEPCLHCVWNITRQIHGSYMLVDRYSIVLRELIVQHTVVCFVYGCMFCIRLYVLYTVVCFVYGYMCCYTVVCLYASI